MQRNNSFFKLIRDKGYYIALGICALAVGISGYLFVDQLEPEETAPIPQTEARETGIPRRPQLHNPVPYTEPDTPVAILETPETEPAETEAPETEAAAPAAAALKAAPPLEGTLLLGYSMDKLSYNPTTRDWRVHNGMDIAAPAGSPVKAAADGVVLSIYEDDLLGRTVTVQHAGGYVTHYANLDETVTVMAGDKVTAGQTLGTVGATALSEVGSEPHLHFAVYRDNAPQDPALFLENP